ncbi:unnamed protein product, partial [Didymodactylos carnosus]
PTVIDESLVNKMVADDRTKSVMFSSRTRNVETYIQWLGGERAVDVPDEYLLTKFQPKHIMDDFFHHIKSTTVDNDEQNKKLSLSYQHHYKNINVNAQCIELLRLRNCTNIISDSQSTNKMNSEQNKQFERGLTNPLRRTNHRRSRLSLDLNFEQISQERIRNNSNLCFEDEAYCTSKRVQQKEETTVLTRKSSSGNSSKLSSIETPILSSSPIPHIDTVDDIYSKLDLAQSILLMESDWHDIARMREIAQTGTFQNSLNLLPMLTKDQSIEMFHEINDDFKTIVDDFVTLIEAKLNETETKMFDANFIRSSSPSLFDTINEYKSCLTLFKRKEFYNLLIAFDQILKMRLPAALPDEEMLKENNLNDDDELLKLSQYAIDELKIVKIEKGIEPLGLTIRSDNGKIHIARIIFGGAAYKSALFQINDEILEVNDKPVTGRRLNDVCTLLSQCTGMIKFLLAPDKQHQQLTNTSKIRTHSVSTLSSTGSSSPKTSLIKPLFIRAMFSYEPVDDQLLPCKELGLRFQRGDILRVVGREDDDFWQAFRETKSSMKCLAGLIPSDKLQQKRVALLKSIEEDDELYSDEENENPGKKYGRRRRKKKTKTTTPSCMTCVRGQRHRNSIQRNRRSITHSIQYNNRSYLHDSGNNERMDNDDKLDDIPTIQHSTNHFSLTDTRQYQSRSKHSLLDEFNITEPSSYRFYEPVFRYDPKSLLQYHHSTESNETLTTRPIILLGAPNVGRHELRRRLLQTEPTIFDVAIPHTTRQKRLTEFDHHDYHFISKQEFLDKINEKEFVEYGEYERHLYGTTKESIKTIIYQKRKICVLNLNPDALQTFEKTDIFPYVICIAAPNIDKLKRLDLDRKEHLTHNDYLDILRQSRSIERRHHMLFDYLIINQDLDKTYMELRQHILRIQNDTQQWIRACYRSSNRTLVTTCGGQEI